MLRTVVPRIYFRNPSVSIIPGKPGAENAIFATILERNDNKLIRHMDMKTQMKREIQLAFMFGTGFGKLGYGAQYTPTPDQVDTSAPIVQDQFRVEYNSHVRANMPWFMSVPPGQIVVPDGLTDYPSTPWVAHHIIRPLEDVKNDPRLSNTKDLKHTRVSPIGDANRTKPASEVYKAVEMIDLYEVRDKRTGMVFVIAPSQSDKPLLVTFDELQVENNLPVFPLIFNEDDEVFWGTPDSLILEPIQHDLNDTRTQIMKHRRLSVVKFLYKEGSISEEQLARMVSETVGAGVAVHGDLASSIDSVQAGHIPQDLWASMEMGMTDARETVGFSRNQFGEYKAGSADATATEAQIVNQAAEIRVDERRDMAADLLQKVVRGVHQIIFRHWDTEQVLELSGPNGVPFWVSFSGRMLANGRYEVSVDPDTSVPETKEVRQAKAFKYYQMFGQDPFFDPLKLRHHIVRQLNDPTLDDIISAQFPQAMGNPQMPIPAQELAGAVQQAGDRGGMNGMNGSDTMQSIIQSLQSGG